MLRGMNDAPSPLRTMTCLLFVPATLGVATAGIGVFGAAGRGWVPVTVVIVVAMTFVAELFSFGVWPADAPRLLRLALAVGRCPRRIGQRSQAVRTRRTALILSALGIGRMRTGMPGATAWIHVLASRAMPTWPMRVGSTDDTMKIRSPAWIG